MGCNARQIEIVATAAPKRDYYVNRIIFPDGSQWLDRLRCLGNGITPPVLRWVLERIVMEDKKAA